MDMGNWYGVYTIEVVCFGNEQEGWFSIHSQDIGSEKGVVPITSGLGWPSS